MLSFGGQVIINQLPADVNVLTVQQEYIIANRLGQDSKGPNAFFINNSTSSWSGTGTAVPGGTRYNFNFNGGYDKNFLNTYNLRDVTYTDGVTRPSWNAIFTWRASNLSGGPTYTTDANGCRSLDLGPSGRPSITYSGVSALSCADKGTVAAHQYGMRIITVTTDKAVRWPDGTTSNTYTWRMNTTDNMPAQNFC